MSLTPERAKVLFDIKLSQNKVAEDAFIEGIDNELTKYFSDGVAAINFTVARERVIAKLRDTYPLNVLQDKDVRKYYFDLGFIFKSYKSGEFISFKEIS